MTQLVTGAGESKANLAMVSAGILDMAVKTGTSTKDLSAGMYMIESAGYHGAAGLAVLQAAAEGAKVGNASLADVANGVTTAMTDYASKNLTAAQATNFLVATVANGKTHMGDLARSMSTILPTAAAVGVSITDVGGAMATMTGEGTGAAQASTYLRQMLMAMASPAHAGAAALKSIGLTTQEVSDGMKKSLPDTLKLIMTHLAETYKVGSPQYMSALKNIAGGAKQMQGMLELTGEHLKTFGGNVGLVSDAMHKGGSSVIGWTEVQDNFNFKISQAKEVVETLMIGIGTALLPTITKLMNAVLPLVTQLSTWITTSGILQKAVSSVSAGLQSAGGVMGDVKGLVMALAGAITHIAVPIGQWLTKGGALKIMLDTVKTVIGNIVPPIAHLTSVVGKIIGDFIQWGDKSGFFNGVLHVLGTTIGTTSAIVGTIIDKFASFIGYLQSGSTPANILKDALIGIGAAIALIKVGNFVADIIAMLPQMVAWIAATWAETAALIAEAIANIAANWPIYLIIAAIAALIAIIVLVVQHWGQIVAFLQGTWKAFSSWFMGALHAVGQFFSNIWNGIVTFITGIWSKIVDFVKSHALLLLAVITGPVGAIVILIVTHFTQIHDFFVNIWNKVVSFVGGIWTYIRNLAVMVFSALYVTISSRIQQIHDFFVSIWNKVVSFVGGLWGSISSKLSDLWNNIKNVFANAYSTYISGPLSNLLSSITGWFGGLGNSALQWGKDLIANFVSGITGAAGSVGNAIQGVANTVKNFLGFSKPDRGPLANFDTYAPDMMKLFATGIEGNIGQLKLSVTHAAGAIAGGMQPATALGTPHTFQLPAMQAQQPVQVIVQPAPLMIDGRTLATSLMPHTTNLVRYNTGVMGR